MARHIKYSIWFKGRWHVHKEKSKLGERLNALKKIQISIYLVVKCPEVSKTKIQMPVYIMFIFVWLYLMHYITVLDIQ